MGADVELRKEPFPYKEQAVEQRLCKLFEKKNPVLYYDRE
jgi:hypothetical protein